jgi:tetratricopeptide (TPR) repeat protein
MLENLLGRVRRDLSDYHGALARHRKALEIATAIEQRIEVARALDGIGYALHGLGNLPAASDHWQRAIGLYDEIGMPETVATRAALESITSDGQGKAG